MGPADLRGIEGMLAVLNEFRGERRIEAAQEIMYEAWETPARGKRVALARKALKLSPLCADAYVLLAEEDAKSVEEELAYYLEEYGDAWKAAPGAVEWLASVTKNMPRRKRGVRNPT